MNFRAQRSLTHDEHSGEKLLVDDNGDAAGAGAAVAGPRGCGGDWCGIYGIVGGANLGEGRSASRGAGRGKRRMGGELSERRNGLERVEARDSEAVEAVWARSDPKDV